MWKNENWYHKQNCSIPHRRRKGTVTAVCCIIKHGDDIKFELVTDASTSVGRAAVEYANSPARKHLYSLIEQTGEIEIQSLGALVKFGGYTKPYDKEMFRYMYPKVILIDFNYPIPTYIK